MVVFSSKATCSEQLGFIVLKFVVVSGEYKVRSCVKLTFLNIELSLPYLMLQNVY